MKLLSVEDAHEILRANVRPLTPRRIGIADALGLVIAEDVASEIDIPPFDNSAMDGYAFRADDVAGADPSSPVDLPVAAFVGAGDPADFEIEKGTAVKVMTGAPVPRGSDGVIPIESVRREGERVRVTRPLGAGENIRRAGDDLSRGAIAARKGGVIDSTRLGILASLGVSEVLVHPTPAIAVLSTGDELIEPGETLSAGKIYDSNRLTITSLFRECGFGRAMGARATDDVDILKERLIEVDSADMIVTIGGISVGDRDHVKDVLVDLGFDFHFHGLNLKPGKPVAFATRDGRPALCLPGNPVSSFVTARLFALPAAEILRGGAGLPLRYERALLAGDVPGRPGRTRFVPVRADRRSAGVTVRAMEKKGSHQFSSIGEADGWIRISAESHGAVEGEAVDFIAKYPERTGRPFRPPFLSIVGNSDHGKTTLIEKLLPLLKNRGLSVGTIKHSPHRHQLDTEGKDSWRHGVAGSDQVGLYQSEGAVVFLGKERRADVIGLYEGLDLVIVEGGGQLADKLIEVWRPETGAPLRYAGDPRLVAIVSEGPGPEDTPCVAPEDTDALLDLISGNVLG